MEQDRIDNLNRHLENGTLIRNEWGDGKERACLLAALSQEVACGTNAIYCPAEVMPKWLAHLTPWMDDSGTDEAWPEMVRRYAGLAARWHGLDSATWARLDFTARKIALLDCRDLNPDVLDRVIWLIDRAIDGDMPSDSEWKAARTRALIVSVSRTSLPAADSAARAAYAAAAAAADVAARAECADVAADVAAAAARAAYADVAVATYADVAVATYAAAADRITSAILDAIETEIVESENELRKN